MLNSIIGMFSPLSLINFYFFLQYGRVNIEKSKSRNSAQCLTTDEISAVDKDLDILKGADKNIKNGNNVISRGVILPAPDLIKSTSKKSIDSNDEVK